MIMIYDIKYIYIYIYIYIIYIIYIYILFKHISIEHYIKNILLYTKLTCKKTSLIGQ